MSSGYSSLEEDSEEYFFTARTSLFKKPSVKPTYLKVNIFTLNMYLFISVHLFLSLVFEAYVPYCVGVQVVSAVALNLTIHNSSLIETKS